MLAKIKFRRDTSANWSTNNPVLNSGEPGFETDTGKLKIGDGTNNWNDLSYIDDKQLKNLLDVDDNLSTGSDAYVLAYSVSDKKWIAKDAYSLYPSILDNGSISDIADGSVDAGNASALYNYVIDGGYYNQSIFSNQDTVQDGGII